MDIIKFGKYEDIEGYYMEVYRDGVLCSDLYFEYKKDLKEAIIREDRINLFNNRKKYKKIEMK